MHGTYWSRQNRARSSCSDEQGDISSLLAYTPAVEYGADYDKVSMVQEQFSCKLLTHNAYNRTKCLQTALVHVSFNFIIGQHPQNAKEPEIIPFAMAAGKIKCASLVNGACNDANNNGGMTSLNLMI
jgi:hypothetical protein